MKSQLTPFTIQKIYGKYLTASDAQCLFDLFTNQATKSQWLDSNTVACWMFKTNKPSEFELMRAKSVLHKLSSYGMGNTKKHCLLDMKVESHDSDYGSVIFKPAYRLSSSINQLQQSIDCFV